MTGWPRDELQKLFGIDHPIIQAPMAGASGSALAAAVSAAGGLGSLGSGTMNAETLRTETAAIRGTTNRPFNLNFFCHDKPPEDADGGPDLRARLQETYTAYGLGDVPPASDPRPPFDDDMLETVLEIGPTVVSFHFGLPSEAAMTALKDRGTIVLSSATTVAEARWLAGRGVDAIIAQGHEAGGHRGTFLGDVEGGTVGTFALVPQIVDAVDLPVIAAGGIADGRGIAAAFILGAAGVQIGTAFASCPESIIDDTYRAALANAGDTSTRVTKLLSGRPARSVRNAFLDEFKDLEDQAAPYPVQMSLVAPFKAHSAKAGIPDGHGLFAGQAVGMSRAVPAKELFEELVAEAQALLR